MSIITNPIVYTIFGQQVPYNRLPIIQISSDSMAFGTIDMLIPLTSATVAAEVFQVTQPTTAESRWIRILPEMFVLFPTCLTWTTTLQNDGHYIIAWQFDPSVFGAVTESFYSLEFFVNTVGTAAIAQGAPKLIVKILDEIIN